MGRYAEQIDTYVRVLKGSPKPGAVIVRHADCPEEWRWRATMDAVACCVRAQLPVFRTIPRAARAISRFTAYHLDGSRWG